MAIGREYQVVEGHEWVGSVRSIPSPTGLGLGKFWEFFIVCFQGSDAVTPCKKVKLTLIGRPGRGDEGGWGRSRLIRRLEQGSTPPTPLDPPLCKLLN